MTPKEKAKELVDIYFITIVDEFWSDYYTIAKQCALIAVGYIYEQECSEYWQEVKQEIEKL
jgi:hypothetical protein